MSLSLTALLALASTISSAYGASEDEKSAEEYDAKVDAWQRERERIAESNREKAERRARRQAFGSAVGSDITILPIKETPLTSRDELPDKPEKSYATELGQTLGTVGSITGGLQGMGYGAEDIPIVGNAIDYYQNGDTNPANANGVSQAWQSSGSPSLINESSYDYTNRYNPKRSYLGQ